MQSQHPDLSAPDAVRARLAAIVESSDDAIVSKTLDGVITSWNRAAERRFGRTAAEALGPHITLIIPPERHAEEEEVLARLRRGERVDHFETVRVAKDGRRIDVSVTVSPVRDGSGRIIGASKIGRDITEWKRLQETRARLLAQEQEARQKAEALNRAKDELLATVSHELRTPLNSIFGWARILQTVDVDEATRARAIAAIVRNAAAQGRLIEDLLDLSRIVTGRMRLDLRRVDLNAVVEAALETVRPAARAKEIALVTALDSGLAPIVAAPDRLQQVVWNLVMNSLKFTPPGGRVEIATRRLADAVELTVTDTGEGIAPSVLPHVFEPFRQEDSSSTRTHGGLGLGLALVRRLVELHGGQVRAESGGKGAGSTFTVTLPAPARASASERATGEQRAADRTARAAPLHGVRVLVIDDDADFRDLAAMILRGSGADVRTAGSAVAAYEVVGAWQPDVVLTDLAMPQEDGFMVLRAMRTLFTERGLTVPIVAITAYGTPENAGIAAHAGFDRLLTKPIDPLQLTTLVGELVDR